MRVNVDSMSLFCMVYKSGNIARVAESCFMSHQAVSKRIGAMEKELGVTLFDRSVKGVVPTKAGRDAYRTFEDMLQSYRKLQARLTDEAAAAPIVRLAIEFYDIDVVSLDAVLAFEQASPERPRIQVKYLSNMECYRQLLSGSIDVALTNRPFINADIFEFHPLSKDRACIVLSAANPLALKERLEVSDLNGQTFLAILDADGTNQAIMSRFAEAGVQEETVTYDMRSLASTIRANRGFHVVPACYTAPLENELGVAVRELEGFDDVFEIGVVLSRDREPKPCVDEFVAYLAVDPARFLKSSAQAFGRHDEGSDAE